MAFLLTLGTLYVGASALHMGARFTSLWTNQPLLFGERIVHKTDPAMVMRLQFLHPEKLRGETDSFLVQNDEVIMNKIEFTPNAAPELQCEGSLVSHPLPVPFETIRIPYHLACSLSAYALPRGYYQIGNHISTDPQHLIFRYTMRKRLPLTMTVAVACAGYFLYSRVMKMELFADSDDME